MRRKSRIKFSPKLQSSSLDDIKRFVPKDALNTPVISNYNTLPTSYQNGGQLPKYQNGRRIKRYTDPSEFIKASKAAQDSAFAAHIQQNIFEDKVQSGDYDIYPPAKHSVADPAPIVDYAEAYDKALSKDEAEIAYGDFTTNEKLGNLNYKGINPVGYLQALNNSTTGPFTRIYPMYKPPVVTPVLAESMDSIPVKSPTQLQTRPLQENRLTPTVIDPIKSPYVDVQSNTAAGMPMIDTKARREGRVGNTHVPKGYINRGDNKGRIDVYQTGGETDPTKGVPIFAGDRKLGVAPKGDYIVSVKEPFVDKMKKIGKSYQNGGLPKYQTAGVVPDNFLQKGVDEGIRDLKNEESLKALYTQNPSMQTYEPKDPGSIDYGPTHVNSGNNPNMQWTNGVATAPWAKQYKQDAFNTELILGAVGAGAEGAIMRGGKALSINTALSPEIEKSVLQSMSPNQAQLFKSQYGEFNQNQLKLLQPADYPGNLSVTPNKVYRSVFDPTTGTGAYKKDIIKGVDAPITSTKLARKKALDINPDVYNHRSKMNVGMSTLTNKADALNVYGTKIHSGAEYYLGNPNAAVDLQNTSKWMNTFKVNSKSNILNSESFGAFNDQANKLGWTQQKKASHLQDLGYDAIKKWGNSPELQFLDPKKNLTLGKTKRFSNKGNSSATVNSGYKPTYTLTEKMKMPFLGNYAKNALVQKKVTGDAIDFTERAMGSSEYAKRYANMKGMTKGGVEADNASILSEMEGKNLLSGSYSDKNMDLYVYRNHNVSVPDRINKALPVYEDRFNPIPKKTSVKNLIEDSRSNINYKPGAAKRGSYSPGKEQRADATYGQYINSEAGTPGDLLDVIVHESMGHGKVSGGTSLTQKEREFARDVFKPKGAVGKEPSQRIAKEKYWGERSREAYIRSEDEVIARADEIRVALNFKDPYAKITVKDLERYEGMVNQSTTAPGVHPVKGSSTKQFMDEVDKDKLANFMNKFYTASAITGAGSQLIDNQEKPKLQNGGFHKYQNGGLHRYQQ